ncbi:MAG TPA: prepilin-type N-terminal cleavage/methylation domain-containing protein [Desulfuromonadales bacterium]|nr:prepilin-type N-terminal cleavage/methylation domain-containing protein [Desulfuromonadales bacterium]
MKNVVRNQQGFTLAEVLVALTIFAIGLLAVAGMQVTAIQTNSKANTLTAATAFAEGVLEEVLTRSIDDPTFAGDSTDNAWTLVASPPYVATFDVDRNYNGVLNVARVTVTVTGGGRTITLVGFKRTV